MIVDEGHSPIVRRVAGQAEQVATDRRGELSVQ
jgi:hypothetical protein